MIPGFRAQSSIYDNINVIVPAIRNVTIGRRAPSINRKCGSFCVDIWANCLDGCATAGESIYPGSPCYAQCDWNFDICIDACV
jgi:hypothetical protein